MFYFTSCQVKVYKVQVNYLSFWTVNWGARIQTQVVTPGLEPNFFANMAQLPLTTSVPITLHQLQKSDC